ncbi:hypothetical protein QYE76_040087 [Lolium multiflorum]|uniref:Uncharacterized protein n=1 Tax=Lolium multiflorum TaxID=4521 RepID=A0AAD8TAX7_LOLMU|nr:hypothetical protein QYE76_040087 [Lolium multiflorum]
MRTSSGPTMGQTRRSRRRNRGAIIEFFESHKKLQDDDRASEEDNVEWWRHVVDLSIRRAPVEEAGRVFFADERWQLLENAAERKQEMDREECRQALLTRVLGLQRLNRRGAEEIVHRIFNVLTLEKIRLYVNEPDAVIHTLIDRMESEFPPRAPSPGSEFPPPSWAPQGQALPADQIGTSQLPGSSSVSDDGMCDFLDPSWNSQGQSSSTSVAVQSAHTGQTETSQLPGLSSVPDNGVRDSLDLSCYSHAQSSGTSVGTQSAQAGQNSQLSSVPGCSNVTGCPPSSSRQWPDTCRFYISRRGLCPKGLSCGFSHGFGSSGKFEMEIRGILLRMGRPVFIGEVPLMYFFLYQKNLPLGSILDPWGLRMLLRALHTVFWIPERPLHFLVLVEHSQAYLDYPDHLRNWGLLGPNLIYISFSAASRSICTRLNVSKYFSQYGPVMSVSIPHERSFGFVRFQYPETVRLLLSDWNRQIPHFILGEPVRVCRYSPKPEAKLKNSAGNHGLENGRAPEIALPLAHNQPSHSQMEIGPLEDHSQPSHSQVEINPPEAGQVPNGLEINPVEGGQVAGGLGEEAADEQIADEIVPALPGFPDVGCFYKQT